MKEEKDVEFMVPPVTSQNETGETVEADVRSAQEQVVEVDEGVAEEEVETAANFEQLNAKLESLGERFTGLNAAFESKIKYDRHKEKIIDNLHKELQDYKNDLAKSLLRPMIMDIIDVIDNNTRLVNRHEENEDTLDPRKLLEQMKAIPGELEEVLYRQGVEPFEVEQPGFDSRRQKIVKTDTTDDEAKNRTVSRCVHKGYRWERKILRREMVDVYLYKPAPGDAESIQNEEKET